MPHGSYHLIRRGAQYEGYATHASLHELITISAIDFHKKHAMDSTAISRGAQSSLITTNLPNECLEEKPSKSFDLSKAHSSGYVYVVTKLVIILSLIVHQLSRFGV